MIHTYSPVFRADAVCFALTVVIGAAWHFFYDWSGGNRLIGLICPVNESVWEHLKLLYFPCLFISWGEYAVIGRELPNFLWARACGVIIGLMFMIIGYYTYSGVIGRHFLTADICLFFLSCLACYVMSHHLTCRFPAPTEFETSFWLAAAAIIGVSLIIFTIYPPHLDIFRDHSGK